MRFLVDNALSPRLAGGLTAAGHDAVHVRDLGLQSADDETLFQLAADQSRILVSEDTDFGTLLALRQTSTPSVILFRHIPDNGANNLLAVPVANLDAVGSYLNKGAVVVIEFSRVRIRRLPIADTHGTQ